MSRRAAPGCRRRSGGPRRGSRRRAGSACSAPILRRVRGPSGRAARSSVVRFAVVDGARGDLAPVHGEAGRRVDGGQDRGAPDERRVAVLDRRRRPAARQVGERAGAALRARSSIVVAAASPRSTAASQPRRSRCWSTSSSAVFASSASTSTSSAISARPAVAASSRASRAASPGYVSSARAALPGGVPGLADEAGAARRRGPRRGRSRRGRGWPRPTSGEVRAGALDMRRGS